MQEELAHARDVEARVREVQAREGGERRLPEERLEERWGERRGLGLVPIAIAGVRVRFAVAVAVPGAVRGVRDAELGEVGEDDVRDVREGSAGVEDVVLHVEPSYLRDFDGGFWDLGGIGVVEDVRPARLLQDGGREVRERLEGGHVDELEDAPEVHGWDAVQDEVLDRERGLPCVRSGERLCGATWAAGYWLDVDDGCCAGELESFEVWALLEQGEEVRYVEYAAWRKVLQCELA